MSPQCRKVSTLDKSLHTVEKSKHCRKVYAKVSKLTALNKIIQTKIKNNETNVFTFYHNICLHLPGILFYQLKIS